MLSCQLGCERKIRFKDNSEGSPSSWANGGGDSEWPVGIGKGRECGQSPGLGVAGARYQYLGTDKGMRWESGG